jgi:hypothetical protein
VSGIADYFAETESEAFGMTRDCVESLNLAPNHDFDVDVDQPAYSSEDLDVYGGLNSLGNPGTQTEKSIIQCLTYEVQIYHYL